MSKKKNKDVLKKANGVEYPMPLFQSVLAAPLNQSGQRGSSLTSPNTASGNRQVARIQWEAYQSSRYLATIIDLIANAASKKWHLEPKVKSDSTADDDASSGEIAVIESFLNAPNPYDTFSSLSQCIIRDLLIHGGCILEQHFSPVNTSALSAVTKSLDWLPNVQAEAIEAVGAVPEAGIPIYLSVLPYDQMEVICDSYGNVTGYKQWTVGGAVVEFAPSEIMFIRHPKSRSKISPESPLNAILQSVRLDAEITQRHLKTLERDLIFDTLFILTGKTEEEAQAFNEVLNLEYSSRGSAGNALVMGGDGISYQKIGTTAADGEYLKLSETLRNIIAMRFGLSAAVMGDSSGSGGTSGSNYSAGTDTQYRIFIENAVRPLAMHVEAMLNRHLLSHFGQVGLDYVLVFDLLDADDSKDVEATWDMMLRNGSTTLNEIRKLRGQKQIEGGDVAMVYTATGAMPVSELAQGTPTPPAPIVHPLAPGVKPEAPEVSKARQSLRDLRKAMG